MTADPFENANEADIEEQEQPILDETADEEAAAGSDVPPRRDDVDEADYQEQLEAVDTSDDDYPYGEPDR